MFRKQPKIASIEQDIAAMSKETGTAVFSYDEIHHSKVDNLSLIHISEPTRP